MAFRALSNDDRYKLAYRNQKSFSSLEIRQGLSEICPGAGATADRFKKVFSLR